MKVPLLDLTLSASLEQKIKTAIDDVLASKKFIMGPQVQSFEKKAAAYCRSHHAIGVSSGTDALLLALMALNIGPGDEVITTPYSFFATAGAIARVGAKPVFVDINVVSFNIEPLAIEKAITKKTKAIMPVHLYGQVADMELILRIARQYKLPVIEDAAQAIGSEFDDGKRVGEMGTIACFSFFPSKNLGAIGDAGLVVTNDPELAKRMEILRVHGMNPKYFHTYIGGNFRLDTIQAAVLEVKLDHLDDWTRQRQENAERYEKLFTATNLIERDGPLHLPIPVYKNSGVPHYHIYNQFVIRAKNRDKLREFLTAAGIGVEVYYPIPLHRQECFASLGHKDGDFPDSEQASLATLALPIYPGLTAEMQQYVVEKIAEFYS